MGVKRKVKPKDAPRRRKKTFIERFAQAVRIHERVHARAIIQFNGVRRRLRYREAEGFEVEIKH